MVCASRKGEREKDLHSLVRNLHLHLPFISQAMKNPVRLFGATVPTRHSQKMEVASKFP